MNAITIEYAWHAAWQRLQKIYSAQESSAMANLLCQHFCSMTRTEILIHWHKKITKSTAAAIENAATLLLKHTPIQYITGYTDFCGCRICVSPAVLIPRPETEELVMHIFNHADKPLNILDICTGSGCIAVALKKMLPTASITGWDISPQALAAAEQNAVLNNVEIKFEVLNILKPTKKHGQKWDIIVSNPPYICENEKTMLPANVLCEPHEALFVPDDDPLLFYRHIADFAVEHLCKNGCLFFEINEKYGADIAWLLRNKNFHDIQILCDINGKNRMVSGIFG